MLPHTHSLFGYITNAVGLFTEEEIWQYFVSRHVNDAIEAWSA